MEMGTVDLTGQLGELNEVKHIKFSAWYLDPGKWSVDVSYRAGFSLEPTQYPAVVIIGRTLVLCQVPMYLGLMMVMFSGSPCNQKYSHVTVLAKDIIIWKLQ